jgi:hypothetical protein
MLYSEHFDFKTICTTKFFEKFFQPVGAFVLDRNFGMTLNPSGTVLTDFSGNGFDLAAISYITASDLHSGYYNKLTSTFFLPGVAAAAEFKCTASYNTNFQFMSAASGIALVNPQELATTDHYSALACSEISWPIYSLNTFGRGSRMFGNISYRHYGQTATSVNTNYQVISNTVIPEHEWSLIGFTRDSTGTQIKLYMNGMMVFSGSVARPPGKFTGGFIAGDPKFEIGKPGNNLADGDAWRGSIQLVCVWDKTLTDQQMAYLANVVLQK